MIETEVVDWDGIERRDCNGCRNLAALENRVSHCKAQFDAEILQVHESVAGLNKEIHGLRSDMSASVGEINASLADIASTLKQLADLPEAWSNVRGFLAVNRWIKENFFLLIILGAVVIYAVKSFGPLP